MVDGTAAPTPHFLFIADDRNCCSACRSPGEASTLNAVGADAVWANILPLDHLNSVAPEYWPRVVATE